MTISSHTLPARQGRIFNLSLASQAAVLMMLEGKPHDEVVEMLSAVCGEPPAQVAAGIDLFLERVAGQQP